MSISTGNSAAKLLSKYEARGIAANIAKSEGASGRLVEETIKGKAELATFMVDNSP